jgi:lipopolysaccharide export system protein LptC
MESKTNPLFKLKSELGCTAEIQAQQAKLRRETDHVQTELTEVQKIVGRINQQTVDWEETNMLEKSDDVNMYAKVGLQSKKTVQAGAKATLDEKLETMEALQVCSTTCSVALCDDSRHRVSCRTSCNNNPTTQKHLQLQLVMRAGYAM